ncbi:phosphatase PAP2 family protein [Leucobacter sp. USHLN154]|uniref:phosphatase PAP2 family protein n=1 Tax=Leucobacter sp. USHLN154 TaxID=3081269 RepID=UPI003016BAAB
MAPSDSAPAPRPQPSAAIRRTPPPAAVAASIATVLLIAAFGAYQRFAQTSVFAIDTWWADTVSIERGSALFAVAVFLAQVGDGIGAAACAVILGALCFALRRPRDGAAILTAAVLGVIASEAVKALTLRTRPTGQLFESFGASYPSGHSMGAAALAVSVVLVVIGSERIDARLRNWIIVAAALWIVAMMWSRTALHVHWLTDTVAGALLGIAAAVIARRLWFGPASAPAIRR